jgi:hypothetical protein
MGVLSGRVVFGDESTIQSKIPLKEEWEAQAQSVDITQYCMPWIQINSSAAV